VTRFGRTARRQIALASVVLAVACDREEARSLPGFSDSTSDGRSVSASESEAIATATQRMREHGRAGFSVDDARRMRSWFTPELSDLLEHDLGDTAGVGYLNWDPFTGAQDDVGPFRFESTRRLGDTVLVRFSRPGLDSARVSIGLAMRLVDGASRIADFVYPEHSPCHRALSLGLRRSRAPQAATTPADSGC
jgi:hypothetical protein